MKSRRTRVTFFVTCYKIGGFETKLDNLVRRLDRKRFETSVLLLYPYYKAKRTPEDVRKRQRTFFSWPGIRTVELFMKNRFDAFQVFRATSALRRLKPDALLFFALGPGTFLAPFAHNLTRAPVLIRVQDTVLDGLYPKALMLLDRMILPLTSLAVVPSVFLKNVLVQGLKLPPGKVKVIANGIDFSRFGRTRVADTAFKTTLGASRNDRMVGMVANLVEVKDHVVLLDAAPRILREIPGVCFLLIGDGPLRESLESRARSLRVEDHVRFLGYRSDVDRILPLLNVAVLCSKVEVHPISLIESMACGVPVVAPDVGGIPEIVRNRETGLLVRQGDPAALADAVLTLLKDPALARRMGESGRRFALRRFSVETMVESFETLFDPERPGR
jgi:glycosyltransferase involved in cell wall biosynthesis